uniref:Uncharacterized protein n=1 Tax=Equus asinus asinus TaxID=83772 RepID=A0A8C4PUW5_EQUAS
MLLLSPALIWHWLPGEGGPEAAAAARPRPPGIFERCSWVPGGWQTWQRRVGRTPKPTSRKGGLARREREEEAGASGHSAAGPRGTPGAGWPKPGPGASPPRGRVARPRAPCCGQAAWPAAPGVQATWAHSRDRGRIVPTPGPAEEQAAAGTPAVLPGPGREPSPQQLPGRPLEGAHSSQGPGRLFGFSPSVKRIGIMAPATQGCFDDKTTGAKRWPGSHEGSRVQARHHIPLRPPQILHPTTTTKPGGFKMVSCLEWKGLSGSAHRCLARDFPEYKRAPIQARCPSGRTKSLVPPSAPRAVFQSGPVHARAGQAPAPC